MCVMGDYKDLDSLTFVARLCFSSVSVAWLDSGDILRKKKEEKNSVQLRGVGVGGGRPILPQDV